MKWEGILFSCLSSNFSIWVKIFIDLVELRIRGCLSVSPSVCRQIKRTSPQKVTSLFSRFIYIWIEQDAEKKVMKRKFKISNLKKSITMLKTDIQKKDFNSKSYKPIFSNTAYLSRTYSSPRSYEAIFSNFQIFYDL